MLSASEWVHEIVAPHYAFLQEEVLPPAMEVWHRLDLPAWEIYSVAVRECASDVIQSTQSTGTVLYLTLRPFAILLWMLFQLSCHVGQILFKLLLEKGWISLQKGAMQAKSAIVWFYLFQRSLSRTEVLGELGIGATMVLLYYLRRWFQRQTYVARATRVFKQKKRQILQSYTKKVHQVAQVSLFLAMTLPHGIFLGVGIAFKVLFPSVVKWLAYDSYTTALLSVWYPLVCTLGWIHEHRHGEKQVVKDTPPPPRTPTSVKALANTLDKATPKGKQHRTRQQPSYMKKTAAAQSRERSTNRKSPRAAGVFPKTTPKVAVEEPKEETPPVSPHSVPLTPEAATKYWLRYWGIYAIVQAFGSVCSMVPVFGRFVARHPFFLSLSAELKLLFFIWIFFMENILGNTAEDAILAQALPIRLLNKHVTPFLLEFESVISEAVSKDTWKNTVLSKAQRVLEIFVMIRFISEPFKDWLLHVLEESRTLLLPSLSLMMPGFVTQFGVAYVQFLVPSAKSAQAKSASAELLYLQYWVLHCLLSGFLTWFSSVLWWVPFSTHAIFIAWCHLSFPQTIAEYYSIIEMELVAFGILKGDPVMAVHETRTVQLLTQLTKRLPSAAEDNDDIYALKEAESNITNDSKNGLTVDTAICDSSPDGVEVAIQKSKKQKQAEKDEDNLSPASKSEENPADQSVGDDEDYIPKPDQENATKRRANKSSAEQPGEEDSLPGLASKTQPSQDDESHSGSGSDYSSMSNTENQTTNTLKPLRRSARRRRKA